MSFSPSDWHARYRQQAGWTADLRHYIFKRIGLTSHQRVLDVGCGTGALLPEVLSYTQEGIFGLDLSRGHLELAARFSPQARLVQGDAQQIPFPDGAFDVAFCHFVLLWVSDPAMMVAEMRRVTRPGGFVLALAEPDYGGRIDYPPELEKLGRWQTMSLRRQGAEPEMGRRLAALFAKVGLREIESGVLGGQWRGASSTSGWDREWAVLTEDLRRLQEVDWQEVDEMQKLTQDAIADGTLLTYVPTFYAWGRR